jgi:sugar phosphate isomerase/epimerase
MSFLGQTARVAVVGCTGFVGSTLMDHLPNADGYNSKNIEDIIDKTYDIIICAGLPAAKWWINQHPDEDLANLSRLQSALAKAECKGRFVLISTIDVHDVSRPAGQDDETIVPAEHAYGKHRLMMEAWVKERYPDSWRIVRLAGLFGVGLKKNVIYDLLNDNMVDSVCMNHSFQWYDMGQLFSDVDRACADPGLGAYNLYSEPVRVDEMVASVFPEFVDRLKDNASPNPVVYAIKTSRTTSGWACSKHEVLSQMRHFVQLYRKMRAGRGKLLSVSNLAWPLAQEPHALKLLAKYGIGNLEVAPTRYGSWEGAIDAQAVCARVHEAGLAIYSTQAVFFGLDVNLFDDPDGFEAHARRVVALTASLGAKRIVLGSPRNRRLPCLVGEEQQQQHEHDNPSTNVAPSAAIHTKIAQQVLQRIGHYAHQNFADVIVCLEPNSKQYGCNFVNTLQEAFRLLEGVASPNIGINLDTGNAEMEGEDVLTVLDACANGVKARVRHIQVSKPFLAAIDDGATDEKFAATLRASFPEHVISLEMKEVCPTLLPTCVRNLYAYA